MSDNKKKKDKIKHPFVKECICIVNEDKFIVKIAKGAINNLPVGSVNDKGEAHIDIESDFRKHMAWNMDSKQSFTKQSNAAKFATKYW